MKYSKPEIVVLGSAVFAVKGVQKPDCAFDGQESSCSAYEADE